VVAVFFLGVLFLPKVSAAPSYAMVSWDRFVGQYFFSQNASFSVDENEHLSMSFRSTQPKLSVNVSADEADASKNAVRISLTNQSACNSFLFTYQFLNREGNLQSVSEKISLGARGVRGDYYVYTDVADRITNMSMTFSGTASGSITLLSIDFVSIYNDKEDVCGTITSCVYDQAKNTIRIGGSINYDIVTAHRKAKLVLYAVDIGEEKLPYGAIPLASVPMSSRFDFSVSRVTLQKRMSAYVVAVIGEGGERLYTFSPRVPTSETEEIEEERFFKGVHSGIGVLSARANARLAIVDVDFSKLVSANAGEGLLYAFGGEYYYFNRQYVSSLDSAILRNYENGMHILLRFMSSERSEAEIPDFFATSDKKMLALYAYTEFLCSRYSSNARGEVSGIVFGARVDQTVLTAVTLEQYTRAYADSLFAMSEAAASVGRKIRFIVPISDHLNDGKKGDPAGSPRVFLTSLGKVLKKRYVGSVFVSVMLESDALSGNRVSDKSLGFEKLGEFSDYLRQTHDVYSTISDQYLYYWEPTAAQNRDLLKASLFHGYYTLACERNAYGFVLSTAQIFDVSLEAELMECLQFIDAADTSHGAAQAEEALRTLGRESWQDVISGFVASKIQTVKYREITDASTPPFRFLGECYLWDFSSMGNDYGWSMGDGCLTLMMEKNETTNRALAASMVPLPQNHYESELIYCFDEKRSFAAVDAVSFALCVNAPNGKYRVTVQICGESSVSEASVMLSAGALSTAYVNTAGLFPKESVRCIRIFAMPIGSDVQEYKLLIGSISAHSTTQTEEWLEQSLRSTQDVAPDVYKEASEKMAPVWIYAIGFLLVVSVMIVVALYFRSEDET